MPLATSGRCESATTMRRTRAVDERRGAAPATAGSVARQPGPGPVGRRAGAYGSRNGGAERAAATRPSWPRTGIGGTEDRRRRDRRRRRGRELVLDATSRPCSSRPASGSSVDRDTGLPALLATPKTTSAATSGPAPGRTWWGPGRSARTGRRRSGQEEGEAEERDEAVPLGRGDDRRHAGLGPREGREPFSARCWAVVVTSRCPAGSTLLAPRRAVLQHRGSGSAKR